MEKDGDNRLKTLEDLKRKSDDLEYGIKDLKEDNLKIQKEIDHFNKVNDLVLSKLNVMGKTDEEILDQLEKLKDSGKQIQKELEQLGETDKEIVAELKKLSEKEDEILAKNDLILANNQKMLRNEEMLKQNQIEMTRAIRNLSTTVTAQYKNLTLEQRNTIQMLIEIGVAQNLTNSRIDQISKQLQNSVGGILSEIERVQVGQELMDSMKKLKTANQKFKFIGRLEPFAIFDATDPFSKERFVENTGDLDVAISDVFSLMDGSGSGLFVDNIFQILDCDMDFFEPLIELLITSIKLYKVGLDLSGKLEDARR